MADSLVRKACDRCHAQKLSCKRAGDEACERCVRLKTECKSSPSLRYKKQQQQQHQHQHQQPQQQSQNQTQIQTQTPSAEPKGGNRSPKRRRTAEMNLVPPETAVSQAGELTAHPHPVVAQDPMLGLADFNFNMDHHQHQHQHQHQQAVFFTPDQAGYLYQPMVPGTVDNFHHHHQQQQQQQQPQQQQHHHHHSPAGTLSTNPWDQRLAPSSSAVFHQDLVTLPFARLDTSPVSIHSVVAQQIPPPPPPPPPPARTCVPLHRRSDRRRGSTAGPRPKQIALRQHITRPSAQERTVSPLNWMSRFTDIHTRLQELSAALPAPDPTSPTASPVLGRPSDERFRRFGFPVAEVFGLAGNVADILNALSTTGRGPEDDGTPPINLSDPGNSLFIISLYVRLLDVFQRIFSLVRGELSHADSHVEFQYWKLPDVSIGSIEVDSSRRFHMALTVQVAQQFLARLRKSTASLPLKHMETENGGQPLFSSNASIFAGTVEDTLAAVQAKEASLAEYLVGLRSELEAFKDAAEYEEDTDE